MKNLISIPRSGQHMTENALRYYHNLMNIPFQYCEYYNCCKSRPCKINPFAYHKNHDESIMWCNGIEINNNDKYLFLFRKSKLQQIEAHFRLYLQVKNINKTTNKVDYNDEKMFEQFKIFFQDNKSYYEKIYNKYLNTKKENILPIEYENFVLNFNVVFEKILNFFDIPINKEFIEKTNLYINPNLLFKIDKNDIYYKKLKKYIKSFLT